ncbi:Uma2 family endonuclease [Streptomyces sp. NPDC047046]|uniref:Uma2 family endonuclease n=1 Tax=Streptomyces sp. NPDC047046 TaxID=3155378 RepID=UPI0033DB5E9C
MGEAMTVGASDTPLVLRRLEDAAERKTAEEAREAASGIGKLLDEALPAEEKCAPRADMPVEDFEELAASAPETVWLEFLDGRLLVKPPSDGAHGELLREMTGLFLDLSPDLWLYPWRGLRLGDSRLRPDGTLAPRRHFRGAGEWAAPAGALLTLDVVAAPSPARIRAHAAARVPLHLLVERERRTLTVCAEPHDDGYRRVTTRPLGVPAELPALLGLSLDTVTLAALTPPAPPASPAPPAPAS